MHDTNQFDATGIKIISLYWDNVDPRLVESQRKVFEYFGFNIDQHKLHKKDHGEWMEENLSAATDDEVVVIVDIDCIPLNRQAVENAIVAARQGHVFGCAQSANHIDHRYVYAAPMFLALTGKTWRHCGQPALRADDEFDAAGRLTVTAQQAGHTVDLIYPSEYSVPKWLLGDTHVYGLFTIYKNSYLHLFESRNKDLIECFVDIANDIVNKNGLVDYREYIIRASAESHNTYLQKYLTKKSIIGKITRELNRFKKRLANYKKAS